MLALSLAVFSGVYLLVFAQRSAGDERLAARRARERPVAGVQAPVQLVARLVRERLVAGGADEPLRRRVDRVDVVLEMRRGQVRLAAGRTLVRPSAGVFQCVQLQAVLEVEPLATLRAFVRLPGAMDRSLVVVEGARRGKRLLTLVAGNSRLSGGAVVASGMSP